MPEGSRRLKSRNGNIPNEDTSPSKSEIMLIIPNLPYSDIQNKSMYDNNSSRKFRHFDYNNKTYEH